MVASLVSFSGEVSRTLEPSGVAPMKAAGRGPTGVGAVWEGAVGLLRGGDVDRAGKGRVGAFFCAVQRALGLGRVAAQVELAAGGGAEVEVPRGGDRVVVLGVVAVGCAAAQRARSDPVIGAGEGAFGWGLAFGGGAVEGAGEFDFTRVAVPDVDV